MEQYFRMKHYISKFIIISVLLITTGVAAESDFNDPVEVAKRFLNAIVDADLKEANKYVTKKLKNNNHWINLTRGERKNEVASWEPVNFIKKGERSGLLIIKTSHGQMAVKFEMEDGRWFWANE